MDCHFGKKILKSNLVMATSPSANAVFTYSEDCVLHKDYFEDGQNRLGSIALCFQTLM